MPRHAPSARVLPVALTFAATLLGACADGAPPAADAQRSEARLQTTVIPRPLPYPGFPLDSATINGWVARMDTVQIRGHAWQLWAALTTMTDEIMNGDTLPVYETWLSRFEVYNPEFARGGRAHVERGRPLDRGFHTPVQFHHPAALAATAVTGWQEERLVAGVKYNMASAEHVWTHNYVDSAHLTQLNDAIPLETPVADRNILPFPNSAVATKPVYWVISQTGLTVMPYWAGVNASTDPETPVPSTWTQFVAIDPTGARVGETVKVTEHGKTYDAKVIGLDAFYSFPLTAEEVAAVLSSSPSSDVEFDTDSVDVIIDGTQQRRQLAAGDRAALVAMHVSTKEIGNWTWQTFWWTHDPASDPLAADMPASIRGPFRHFAMQQAYYMTVPSGPSAGQDQVTFNPYLETAFGTDGTSSNCMSCHQAATWPGVSYVFSGDVSPGDTEFQGQLKLDFLWSVQAGATTQNVALRRRMETARRAP